MNHFAFKVNEQQELTDNSMPPPPRERKAPCVVVAVIESSDAAVNSVEKAKREFQKALERKWT